MTGTRRKGLVGRVGPVQYPTGWSRITKTSPHLHDGSPRRQRIMIRNRERTFSVCFQQHTDRPISDNLRGAWLAEIAKEPGFAPRLEYIRFKDRTVYTAQLDACDLAITHHEWGIEYIFSFALGVASSIVASVIYDTLKSHLPRYRKAVERFQSDTQTTAGDRQGEIRVEVEIDTPSGPARIAVVQRSRESFTATRKQIQQSVELVDGERLGQ